MLGFFVFYINKIFVEAAQIEPFQVKVKYKYSDLGVYASMCTKYTNCVSACEWLDLRI